MSFWSEIKQRRTTQIVLTYLAGGWMLLAVVDQVVDREVLPPVVYEVSLTLYLFGIAAAVVIGWYHGEKGHQAATPMELGILAVVAVAALGTSVQVVRRALQQDTLATALADSGSDLRKIAVLYLDDLSPDGSGEAVADGITEGLIRTLAQVPELDVTSQNGSQRVRDLDVSRDSVARILGAGTLVDGTVDATGNDIRVSVRVLEGASGIPLFRDSYTWPASDLANVGNALAQEVANALREQLGQEIRLRESRFQAPTSGAWLRQARAERSYKDAGEALGRGDADAATAALAVAEAEAREAAGADPQWVEPLILQGRLAYQRIPLAHSLDDAQALLEQSTTFADRALELEPNNAAAFELRGTNRYRSWLFRFAHDEAELDRLLAGARSDLESARDFDPRRASAFSTLSHLYYQVGDLEEAVMSARQAYRQDAFLSVADEVLWRLYSASYDLDDYRQAGEWCAEGRRRFPDANRFVECQIWLMTMASAEHDVDRAWSLLEELRPLLPEAGRTRLEAVATMAVGGVIGLAGLPDSASAVLASGRLGPDADPESELLSVEAAMHSIIGDTDGAVQLLQRYVLVNPGHFGRGERLHWWWRPLQGNPTFENLRSLN